MEAIKALDIIESFESRLAFMYEKLSDAYKDNTEVFHFFMMMGVDERSHRNLARMQKRIVRNCTELKQTDVEIDMQEIAKVMETAKYILGTDLPLKDIMEKVYHIESSIAETYVFTALKGSNEEISKMLQNFGDSYKEHLSFVKDFVAGQGFDTGSFGDGRLRHSRVPFNEPVIIDGSTSVMGMDIAEGGMFLSTDAYIPKNRVVSLEAPMMDTVLKVKGKVMHDTVGMGIGVTFLDLTDKERSVINKYIERRIMEHEGSLELRDKLLLVNSGAGELERHAEFLSEAGYAVNQVYRFSDAALFMTNELDFKVIVVSVELEDEDNFKLIRYIKKHLAYATVPLVALTLNSNSEFRKQLISEGVQKVLDTLDTTPETLQNTLRGLLSPHSLAQ